MSRSTRNKKKNPSRQPHTEPIEVPKNLSFAEVRYPLVLRVVAARREGDLKLIEAAERAFVTILLGDAYAEQDDDVRDRVHPDHRHLSPVARTEELASELHDAIKAVRGAIPGEGHWGLSATHPFTVGGEALADLWRLRHTLDHIGMPYYIYAKAAAIYWVFDRKGHHVPSIEHLDSTDIMLQALDMWSTTDEQDWKLPMRQILEACLNEDLDEAA